MGNFPADLKYTKDHEWVRVTGKDKARVGITDYAQKQLGDIVFVELPKAGAKFKASESIGTVESVKSVSEIYSPLTGTITAVNEDLNEEPEQVNEDPYGDGWFVEITLTKADELKGLLDAAQYEEYIAEG
ncbi:glycine cleavage system protein GcvH [Kitasatospora sp. HPMI-4]|uniref:glycine cleavage system protein GcvH n=1 Tax=Kitasatospora sp. HPMI-4 TaxID=3448443 RepID=UPI003F1BD12A